MGFSGGDKGRNNRNQKRGNASEKLGPGAVDQDGKEGRRLVWWRRHLGGPDGLDRFFLSSNRFPSCKGAFSKCRTSKKAAGQYSSHAFLAAAVCGPPSFGGGRACRGDPLDEICLGMPT